MNLAQCANCLLHGWKQVENLSSLQRCSKCKLIQYCGKDCQAEHWKRVHKKQCKYFEDPVKAQKWGHNEDDCILCLKAHVVGQTELCRASNPNYECILKETFPSHMYHHVRKIGGQITEWRLETIGSPTLNDLLVSIEKELGIHDSMEDLFLTIQLVNGMLLDVYACENLLVLINPLADFPPDLQKIVSQALSNTTNYLALVNQVLEALTTQVVPHQELLRIICGGSLDKRCAFCSENTTVRSTGGIPEKGAAIFNCLFMGIFHCGADTCYALKMSMLMQDYAQIHTAVLATVRERESAQLQCAFCWKLSPSKGGHRCSRCFTVMYCSVACRDQDRQVHKDFCKEEVEERKQKFGSSARRKEAREVLDNIGGKLESYQLELLAKGKNVPGPFEAMSKLKRKNRSKKANK